LDEVEEFLYVTVGHLSFQVISKRLNH
jgi:hypothetical protein